MADTMYAGLSFEQVVKAYNQTVVSVCVMRLKNMNDAEDCFQNTFVRLYQKSPEFSDEEHLKAWLIRVAINECTSYIRKNRRTVSLSECKEQAVEFPHDDTDISWALMQLEDKYREVLFLYYIEKYKVNEIADIVGRKPNTVKTLLSRGREKLRTIYGGDSSE
ncbi:MAG: sigma-70 family RNA polymerase sigma factor [Ruminococcus sp.]|nr:sigma-70 family RNA polymerase sigma factor [Ruminococcus sp.]